MSEKDPDMNFFCESIYGMKTKQGIVQIQWDDSKFQLSILQAKKVAHMILECANAAEVDAQIFEFFSKLPGPDSMQLAALIIKEIRASRGKNDPRIFED